MYGIKFETIENKLILEYIPVNNTGWVIDLLANNNIVSIKKTFDFEKKDLFDEINFEQLSENDMNSIESVHFVVGNLESGYYRFNKNILGINYDLFIAEKLSLKEEYFVAKGNISIFAKIGNIISHNTKDIFIGNREIDTFSIDYFKSMIKSFPNKTELEHYNNARVDIIVKEFVETKKDLEEVYKKYMTKKPSVKGENILLYFQDYEKDKYNKISKKLEYMLKNESDYDESNWQSEILQIIRLIFPKYIRAFEGVTIKDTDFAKSKYLDFMLVDANGNIDIAEIKQPFSHKNIVSMNQYRNNHIPLRELSGSIMQVEKYIYNLTRWGERGENILTERYIKELPKGFKIKITNPNGLIIMGREDRLTEDQKKDFEIIKRKYKNVIDILTYDDLLRRLHILST